MDNEPAEVKTDTNAQSTENTEIKKKEYICEQCGKSYTSKTGLNYHLKKVHNIDNKLKKDKEQNTVDQNKSNENTETENKGISESEIPISQIEDEKEKFLENLENNNLNIENEADAGAKEEETKKSDFVSKILEDIDYAELYVGVFSLIAKLLYNIDIYKYPDLIERLKRRGRLIKIIADKYINNEETVILITLVVDGVDDFMFLMSLKKKEKEKDTEKKESGKNE